jgi:hypothetical protein
MNYSSFVKQVIGIAFDINDKDILVTDDGAYSVRIDIPMSTIADKCQAIQYRQLDSALTSAAQIASRILTCAHALSDSIKSFRPHPAINQVKDGEE